MYMEHQFLNSSQQAARLLRSWVRIPPGAWIFVCCECRVLSGRGLCDELITRPEESYRLLWVIVCDLETSRIGAPYTYDISSLRVNDLTLILLMWRKWWAPNNASEQQMRFNSSFKGLIFKTLQNFNMYWKTCFLDSVYVYMLKESVSSVLFKCCE